MVVIESTYEGSLRCRSVHTPSGAVLVSDAPADMGGKASSFSPTDLAATSLLTCIMTTMALVAARHGLELEGMSGRVEKIMRTEAPRRIARLNVTVKMPIPADHEKVALLQRAAESCPVHMSLHPEVEECIEWEWS